MESVTQKAKSYLTAIFIAGIAASVISVYTIGSGLVWQTYALLLLLLCLLIGLYSVATNQQKKIMEMANTNEDLKTRLGQFQSQVGRKKEATVETKATIKPEDFIKRILPNNGQEFESIVGLTEHILTSIAKELDLAQGLFFVKNSDTENFKLEGRYAYFSEELPHDFVEGEGLSGQVAKDKTVINITDIPTGYITIVSGLGSGNPKNLLVIPAVSNGVTVGVLELASFHIFTPEEVNLFTKVVNQLGECIVNYSTR